MRAEKAHRWNGEIWLVVMLPDGFPGRVRASETDLIGSSGLEQLGTASLSVEGIRGLREGISRLNSRQAVGDEQ